MVMKQRYFLPDRLPSESDLVHSVVKGQDSKHIFTSDLLRLSIIIHYVFLHLFKTTSSPAKKPSFIVIATVKHPLKVYRPTILIWGRSCFVLNKTPLLPQGKSSDPHHLWMQFWCWACSVIGIAYEMTKPTMLLPCCLSPNSQGCFRTHRTWSVCKNIDEIGWLQCPWECRLAPTYLVLENPTVLVYGANIVL